MNRIQRLLAATDFSAAARHAAERAARVARATGAGLDLVHVGEFSRVDELRRLVSALPPDVAERMREQAQMLLDALAATLRERHGVAARTHLATGSLLTAIEETAGAVQADLLVLGARGASMLRHLLLGSTAHRLVSGFGRPMLVVKHAPAADYGRVLVPMDLSETSVAALRLARAVAPDARLVAMHAYEAPFEGKLVVAGVEPEHLREYREQAREEARERMDAICEQAGLRDAGVTQVLVHGPATRSILEQEEEHDCDLVVVARQGQSRTEDLLLGSVSRRVLAEADADVLVLP
jgi:nucleotide-binding universal stress UspA family protein